MHKKFVVIVNKLPAFFKKPKKYLVHKTRYPTKNEVYRYIVQSNHIGARKNPREEPVSQELIKEILNLDKYNMRRIQYAIEDGYLSGEIKIIEEKFNITKMSPYIISFYIAENLPNLRRFKNEIITADKLKYVNKSFYLDFIKLHYPNIGKKRLRYPKQLLDITKKK